MHGVVMDAVVEVSLEAGAYRKAALLRDGDVAQVEEAVDVGPEQEAVRHLVSASLGIGPHMRGIQNGERSLARDGAAPAVAVRHGEAEGPLPQPPLEHRGRAVARASRTGNEGHGRVAQAGIKGHSRALGRWTGSEGQSLAHCLPERQAVRIVSAVPFPRHRVGRKARGSGQPEFFGPEEGLGQDAAADHRVLALAQGCRAAELRDGPAHRTQVWVAVIPAERIPGQRQGREACMREHASARDGVPRRLKLEEEEVARPKRPELPRAGRLPEVHLVGADPSQEVEPGLVRDANEDAEHARTSSRDQHSARGPYWR